MSARKPTLTKILPATRFSQNVGKRTFGFDELLPLVIRSDRMMIQFAVFLELR